MRYNEFGRERARVQYRLQTLTHKKINHEGRWHVWQQKNQQNARSQKNLQSVK